MAANEIHIGDIGTILECTLKDGDSIVDVSEAVAAEAKTIYLLKPDNTLIVCEAEFKTDGVDGIIRYVTVANDLDQLGKWKIQARVNLSSGTWSSDINTFKVHDNLPGVVMPT
jgi:hypothetical protein